MRRFMTLSSLVRTAAIVVAADLLWVNDKDSWIVFELAALLNVFALSVVREGRPSTYGLALVSGLGDFAGAGFLLLVGIMFGGFDTTGSTYSFVKHMAILACVSGVLVSAALIGVMSKTAAPPDNPGPRPPTMDL